MDNGEQQEKYLLRALGVNRDIIESISFQKDKGLFLVRVRQDNAGFIFGRNANNLKSAEKIVSQKIKVEVI